MKCLAKYLGRFHIFSMTNVTLSFLFYFSITFVLLCKYHPRDRGGVVYKCENDNIGLCCIYITP